jgi:outer membrane protein assembly factor BamB
MSTLQYTPVGEYLDGKLYKFNKETGVVASEGVPFNYSNIKDSKSEIQPIKGVMMGKRNNIIYSSSQYTFTNGDMLELEDQPGTKNRKRKVVNVDIPSSKKRRKKDMRYKDLADKNLMAQKEIWLE